MPDEEVFCNRIHSEQALSSHLKPAFTVIELLIVIVVIGILAAISIVVAYNGIINRTEVAVVKAELRNEATKLNLSKAENDEYPATISGQSVSDSDSTVDLQYVRPTASTFCLQASSLRNVSVVYHITDTNTVGMGSCPSAVAACFDFNSSTQTIIRYREYELDNSSNPACPRGVAIPEEINGTVVANIGDAAFNSRQITSVIIPRSVISIRLAAFVMNQLTNVVIPTNVTSIGGSAFSDNRITSATVHSRASIDASVFSNNYDIESVVTASANIASGAFAGRKITSLTLLPTVETIGSGAFANNQIQSVTIPHGVTSVGGGAFFGNDSIVCNVPLGATFNTSAIECTTITTY